MGELPAFTPRAVAVAALAGGDPDGHPVRLLEHGPAVGSFGRLASFGVPPGYVCNGLPCVLACTGAAVPWTVGDLVVVPHGGGYRMRPARVGDVVALSVFALAPDPKHGDAPNRPLPALVA